MSVDPDQMSHSAAPDQNIHFLPVYSNTYGKYIIFFPKQNVLIFLISLQKHAMYVLRSTSEKHFSFKNNMMMSSGLMTHQPTGVICMKIV